MAPLAGVIVAQLLVSLGADPSPCVQHKSISECIAFRRQHGCAWDVPTKQCQPELSCEQRQSLESCHSELTTGSQALWDDTRNKCFWDGAGNKCRWSDECFGPRSASECAAAGCEWGKHCTPADMATKPGPGHCFESCKVPSSGTGAPQPHAQQPTSVQKTYLQAGTTGTTDVVHTSTGPVQGLQHGAVQEYLGIPFAQPPVGDLRWAAPQKMSQWNQVFQATAFGPACTQAYSYYGADDQSCKGYTRGKCFGYTEDCLTLNVWTPSSSGSRAVLLWIHGGCYVSGSASEADYNASALASREDVVVVSIQYRLGVFGFLGASVLRERDPKGSTGNYGLLDAVAAMQWVQENIAAFGGDPERVTIFGESSGAGSVGLLLGIQESWPYFSGAIMESGAGSFWSYITLEGAHTNFEKVVSTAKCSNSSRLLSCLVSSSQTVVAEAVDTVPCKDGCTWAPVVDGVFVRGTPLEMAKAESLRPRTPIMAGFNLNDGAMFVPGYPFSEYTMTSDTLRSYYSDLYGEERVETLEGLFPAAKSKPLWVSKYFHAAQACETDFSYSCSAQWMASLSASHGSPSFVYKFSQKSSQGLVLHGDEIPYIFGTLSSPSGEQQKVSKWMMKYWANFARKGNPNGESHGQAGHDLPFWPVWDSPGSAVSLLNISSTPAVASFAENAWPGCSFFLENWDFYSLCLPQGRREAGDVSYIV